MADFEIVKGNGYSYMIDPHHKYINKDVQINDILGKPCNPKQPHPVGSKVYRFSVSRDEWPRYIYEYMKSENLSYIKEKWQEVEPFIRLELEGKWQAYKRISEARTNEELADAYKHRLIQILAHATDIKDQMVAYGLLSEESAGEIISATVFNVLRTIPNAATQIVGILGTGVTSILRKRRKEKYTNLLNDLSYDSSLLQAESFDLSHRYTVLMSKITANGTKELSNEEKPLITLEDSSLILNIRKELWILLGIFLFVMVLRKRN